MQITTVSDIITKKVLNENTGELETQDFKQMKNLKRIRGGFRMVYKQYDEAVIGVVSSKIDLEIVVYIRDTFTYKQTEQALNAVELAGIFKVTRQKISNLLKKMVEVKLLMKVRRGVYRLNPYMYLPYKANSEELQAEWNDLTR